MIFYLDMRGVVEASYIADRAKAEADRDLHAFRARAADHAAGKRLAEMGTADRRPDAGTAGRGKAVAKRAGRDREVPRTGHESATDLQLFERQLRWLKVQRNAQGQLDLIQREMKRRKRCG